MRRNYFKLLVILLVVSMFGVLSAQTPLYAAEKKIKLVGQSLFAPSEEIFKMGQEFAKMVEKYSDGKVEIEFHSGGEIVPAGEVFNAASSGVIDFAEGCPCLGKGRSYSLQFFCDAPGAQSPSEKMAWYYLGGGEKIFKTLFSKYYGLYPLPTYGATAEVWLYSNKEIKTLEDLKKLKMRAAGVRGDVLSKLGVSVVVLNSAEIVPAMDRGVIDAFEYASINSTYPLGYCDVAKYLYYHPTKSTSPLNFWVMNEKKWKSLPKDVQDAFNKASRDSYMKTLALNIMKDLECMKKAVEQNGCKIQYLPKAVIDHVDNSAADFYYAKAKSDPDLKLILDSWAKFKKEYGPYGPWIDDFNKTGRIGLTKGDS